MVATVIGADVRKTASVGGGAAAHNTDHDALTHLSSDVRDHLRASRADRLETLIGSSASGPSVMI